MSESAVLRISRALATLAEALPDACSVVTSVGHGRRSVSIQCDTDDGVRVLAATIGRDIREVTFDGSRWIDTTIITADVSISISGPHTKIAAPASIDEAAVSAALEQAQI